MSDRYIHELRNLANYFISFFPFPGNTHGFESHPCPIVIWKLVVVSFVWLSRGKLRRFGSTLAIRKSGWEMVQVKWSQSNHRIDKSLNFLCWWYVYIYIYYYCYVRGCREVKGCVIGENQFVLEFVRVLVLYFRNPTWESSNIVPFPQAH